MAGSKNLDQTLEDESLKGFFLYLSLAVIVFAVFLAFWYFAAFQFAESKGELGGLRSGLIWIKANSESISTPFGLVLSSAVAFAGSLVAIKLSNNALRLSKRSAQQQSEQMRIDRHQKAIEICSVISPVASEVELAARDVTRVLLSSLADVTTRTNRLLFDLSKVGELDNSVNPPRVFVNRTLVRQAVSNSGLVGDFSGILAEISDNLFKFYNSFGSAPEADTALLNWQPYSKIIHERFELECIRAKNSRKPYWDPEIVEKLDHRPKVNETIERASLMNPREVAAYTRARAGELDLDSVVEAFMEYFGGMVFVGAEPEARVGTGGMNQSLKDANLIFFASLFGLERRSQIFGYIVPDEDDVSDEVSIYHYRINTGVPVLLMIMESLPTSVSVEKEFSRLITSMTASFEENEGSESRSLRTYVENFLRVHTASHDGNRLAVESTRNLLCEIAGKDGGIGAGVFLVDME